MGQKQTVADRFWSKVIRLGLDECWLWQSATNWAGYPLFSLGGRQRKATHVALELDGRPRPEAPANFALHSDKCQLRSCVNPRHLRWGTQQDNVDDCRRAGRTFSPRIVGEQQHASKLTEDLVRYIRQSSKYQYELAAELGVDQTTVGRARRGDSWAHVS